MNTLEMKNAESVMVVIEAADKDTTQSIKIGTSNIINARAGDHYRITRHLDGKEVLLDDVIATRQGEDLVLDYAEDTQVIFTDYFKVFKEGDCSITVACNEATGHVLTADGKGIAIGDVHNLIYAHGNSETLMAMVQESSPMHDLFASEFGGKSVDGVTWLAASGYTITQGLGALSAGAVMGHIIDGSGNTAKVDTVVSSIPTIDVVASDDVISLSEKYLPITGTTEAGSTVRLLIAGNMKEATVSGTTWRYTLDDTDIAAMGSGTEEITAIATDRTGNVSVSRVKTVTVEIVPTIDVVAGDDMINFDEQSSVITGTTEAGSTVRLLIAGNIKEATVSGTTWSYTLDNSDITAMGAGAEEIIATAINVNTADSRVKTVTVDIVAPEPVSLVEVLTGDYYVGDRVMVKLHSGDLETGWTLSSKKFNGQDLTEITDMGDGSYTAIYTVKQGDADVVDGDEIVTDLAFADVAGNISNSSITSVSLTGSRISATTIELSALSQNNNSAGFVINGVYNDNETRGNSGESVSVVGDINGDDLSDLIIGATGIDNYTGASYVVYGKDNNDAVALSDVVNGSGGFVISGISQGDRVGKSVSTAGDVNGDGLVDLFVGATNVNGSAGAGYVVFGKDNNDAVALSDVIDGTGGFVINGAAASSSTGNSVSTAGDVNGDGLADLIIGARLASLDGKNSAGASYVVFGKTDSAAVELSAMVDGTDSTSGFVIKGATAEDWAGSSVSTAGDVNGDGLADLIVGARYPSLDGKRFAGASYVVFGKKDSAPVELSAMVDGTGFVIKGAEAGGQAGFSVSAAGDINGDGLADLFIGAPKADRGAGYVVFGKANGGVVALSEVAQGTGGFVINGAGDEAGYSVSAAGDVNGDGLPDLIIGDRSANGTSSANSSGASYVVYGKTGSGAVELSDVVDGVGGFVINGVSGYGWAGNSVSTAGDVNGDGFADLLVGAPKVNDTTGGVTYYHGASYVVYGGQGSNATVGTLGNDTMDGDSNANQLVAGRGDDLLIGNGGADVLRGGEGNDVLAISDANFASLDGGLGTDTLRLDTSLALDFSILSDDKVKGIETIDLAHDGGNSSLTLNQTDVLNIGDSNDLVIHGTNGDAVILKSNTNAVSGNWSVSNAGGVNTYAYGDHIRVLIDEAVAVSVI